MAATQKKQIWFWSTTYKDPPPMRNCLMAGSQGIIMPGSPVESNVGYIELSDTDDVTMLGFLVGVTDRSKTWPLTAALSAADQVRVVIARVGDLYAVYCDNNDTDCAVAQASVDVSYGMRVSGVSGMVGYCSMDINETSTVMFKVVNLASNIEPAKYTTSDNPGVAIVKIVGTLQG